MPGNATQPTSFGPNQLVKLGAKLVISWEDVEELPTPVRAELVPMESASGEERVALLDESFAPAERTLYELLKRRSGRPYRRNYGVFRSYFVRSAGDTI